MKAIPTNNPRELDEDTGEFACFHRLDALAAYLYQRHGKQVLRQALAMGDHPREFLTDAAEELEKRGLDHVGHILRDIAKDCPSELDLGNPYNDDRASGGHNWEEWRRMWSLKRQLATGELEADLRQHHAQNSKKSRQHSRKPAIHGTNSLPDDIGVRGFRHCRDNCRGGIGA